MILHLRLHAGRPPQGKTAKSTSCRAAASSDARQTTLCLCQTPSPLVASAILTARRRRSRGVLRQLVGTPRQVPLPRSRRRLRRHPLRPDDYHRDAASSPGTSWPRHTVLGWSSAVLGHNLPGPADRLRHLLLRQFFATVPDDLIAAARLDGLTNSRFGGRWRCRW